MYFSRAVLREELCFPEPPVRYRQHPSEVHARAAKGAGNVERHLEGVLKVFSGTSAGTSVRPPFLYYFICILRILFPGILKMKFEKASNHAGLRTLTNRSNPTISTGRPAQQSGFFGAGKWGCYFPVLCS